MKLWHAWQNLISVVSYVPHSGYELKQFTLPQFPNLISIEKASLFLLFIVLIFPLLQKHKDVKYEKERVNALKLATLIGGLALAIHFYRAISGK